MNCHELMAQADDYLAGTLPPLQLRIVTEHISACADCRAAIDWWRTVRRLLTDAPRTQPPPKLTARLRATATEAARSRSRRPRSTERAPAPGSAITAERRLHVLTALAAAVAMFWLLELTGFTAAQPFAWPETTAIHQAVDATMDRLFAAMQKWQPFRPDFPGLNGFSGGM